MWTNTAVVFHALGNYGMFRNLQLGNLKTMLKGNPSAADAQVGPVMPV